MKKVTINIPDDCELVQTGEGKWEQRKMEKKFPKTWEEFCEMNPIKDDEYYLAPGADAGIQAVGTDFPKNREVQYKDILPNKETAGAILALMQLLQLRNCYNGVWEPDWTRPSEKYVIRSCCKDSDKNIEIITDHEYHSPRILTFKSEELCDQFLENFRDLIEIAKPLI